MSTTLSEPRVGAEKDCRYCGKTFKSSITRHEARCPQRPPENAGDAGIETRTRAAATKALGELDQILAGPATEFDDADTPSVRTRRVEEALVAARGKLAEYRTLRGILDGAA